LTATGGWLTRENCGTPAVSSSRHVKPVRQDGHAVTPPPAKANNIENATWQILSMSLLYMS
jgi:hypothetical protein